jgi:MYXO-CTERM domain-containing protein
MGVGLLTAPAFGGTIIATLDSLDPSSTLHYSLNGSDATTLAGVFNWTRTGGSHGLEIGTAFDTFCIELTQGVALGGSHTLDVIPVHTGPIPGSPETGGMAGMGLAKADDLAKLWAEYYDDALLSAAHAAAFQTAVWEIVYDDGNDLGSGAFQAQKNDSMMFVDSFVNTSVAWLANLPSLTNRSQLVGLSSASVQDQVTVVPEPAALSVLALGAVTGLRRRRA